MKIFISFLLTFLLLSASSNAQSDNDDYLEASPEPGDALSHFLSRYNVNNDGCNRSRFYELNNLDQASTLILGQKYKLPILVYKYNSKNIRSTIDDSSYEKALRIQHYNENMSANKIKTACFREDKELWVPYNEIYCVAIPPLENEGGSASKDYIIEPLFGKKYEKVIITDRSLDKKVYYIVSGHGGPDPGAVSAAGNHMLCEDEYAYDTGLRLARNLMSHGAIVYMIVQDQNDGIRDDRLLDCDTDERDINGVVIPLGHLSRLQQRVSSINELYLIHKKDAIEQLAIMIHVDSRSQNLRQDIFFYYDPNSSMGKEHASKMHYKLKEKYSIYRSNGSYSGTLSSRNLYVLRKTYPPAVFIELANIQNVEDRKRFLPAYNRQNMADWLAESILDGKEI